MSFLPDKYKVPSNNNYLNKLPQGQTTFRVLSSAITGYEYWTTENKPVRQKEKFSELPLDIKINPKTEKLSSIKHFWAFVIWNYNEEKIQIMELTQATIQKAIKDLVDNKKWGDPKKYDITITRTGDNLATEYGIMPNPHNELPEEIVKEFESKKIKLEALYSGDDPFASWETAIEDAIDKQSEEIAVEDINL